ncbi:MAG: hypothetical protein MJ228_04170 [Bacilli bacterium]|nr:hypothetical protein [Bacilli bacterium]
MDYLFIKKAESGYDFCSTTNDCFNDSDTPLDKFRYCDSSFQTISNGKFLIIYRHVHALEASFAKMFFEDNLKDKDDLEIDEIRFGLTDALKEVMRDCKRLHIGDKKEDKRDKMTGEIIIIAPSGLYYLTNYFSVEKQDKYFNGNATGVLSQCEIIGDVSPLELMEEYIKDYKTHSAYVNYPIVYGNSNEDYIVLRDVKDREIKVEKEKFVCLW